MTVATFFAFDSIGVVLPVPLRCTESPLDAGSVAVGIAVGAARMTALLAQPSAGRLERQGLGWLHRRSAALRHGAGGEDETDDPKQAYARFRCLAPLSDRL